MIACTDGSRPPQRARPCVRLVQIDGSEFGVHVGRDMVGRLSRGKSYVQWEFAVGRRLNVERRPAGRTPAGLRRIGAGLSLPCIARDVLDSWSGGVSADRRGHPDRLLVAATATPTFSPPCPRLSSAIPRQRLRTATLTVDVTATRPRGTTRDAMSCGSSCATWPRHRRRCQARRMFRTGFEQQTTSGQERL